MTTESTASELRKTGISVVGDMPWGTHLCHFYETKEDLLDILIPYFKAGLENNEFCTWVVSDPLGEEEARDALRQAVPEADRYLAAGHIEIVPHTLFPASRERTSSAQSIEIIPHTDWYLKNGAFIAERVLNGWKQKLADALAKGYAGLRANGNEAWLTEENWKAFSDYEKTLDKNLAGQRMIVLCSYPVTGSSAAQVFDVVKEHQLGIIRRRGQWEIVETPELIQAKTEIKRLNDELEKKVEERTRELAAANRQLKILSRRRVKVQEEERRHLARELHDEIGQALSAAKINLQTAMKESDGAKSKRIRETAAILDRLLGQVRQISLDLRPLMLDDLGLVPALRSLLDEHGRRASVAVRFSAENMPENLDPEIQTTCFRIAQEAITNAVRHANATRIDVDLGRENGNLRLQVRDNGRGFDAESVQEQVVALGLIGIKERAALVDARARIISSPNKGTTVEVSLPLTPLPVREGRETGK